MGQVLLTCEEANERSASVRDRIPQRAPQCRIARLERVDHGSLRWLAGNFDAHLSIDVGECSQVCWQYDPDHANV